MQPLRWPEPLRQTKQYQDGAEILFHRYHQYEWVITDFINQFGITGTSCPGKYSMQMEHIWLPARSCRLSTFCVIICTSKYFSSSTSPLCAFIGLGILQLGPPFIVKLQYKLHIFCPSRIAGNFHYIIIFPQILPSP